MQTLAQLFAYKYTINALSKWSNIISHRSSVFEGRQQPSIFEGRHIDHPSSKVDTSIIDPRRSTHRSSIFESRHIDRRRSKAETSHRQFVTEYCPQLRFIVILKIPRGTYNIRWYKSPYTYKRRQPTCAIVMYYMPIYIAYMC